uniref:Uncharacterized protein n=1 Tax=Rhizophora mucronata TaxID=61149 RepID=A0A2P2KH14_RHIMU
MNFSQGRHLEVWFQVQRGKIRRIISPSFIKQACKRSCSFSTSYIILKAITDHQNLIGLNFPSRTYMQQRSGIWFIRTKFSA